MTHDSRNRSALPQLQGPAGAEGEGVCRHCLQHLQSPPKLERLLYETAGVQPLLNAGLLTVLPGVLQFCFVVSPWIHFYKQPVVALLILTSLAFVSRGESFH